METKEPREVSGDQEAIGGVAPEQAIAVDNGLTEQDRDRIAKLMYSSLKQYAGALTDPAERASNNQARPFAGDIPRCFTAVEYGLWKKAAREASPGPIGPCADCTPGRQAHMKQAGRCERVEVRFRYDSEGWIEGFWPSPGRRKHRKTDAK